jgi:hypothetical protein
MVRLLLMAALLSASAECVGTVAKDVLDDPPALKAAAYEVETQFKNDETVVKFKPPTRFNPSSSRPEVTQALELAASVKRSEMEISQLSPHDLGWTKDYICDLFGFWERVRDLALPSPETFQERLTREFLYSFMSPSQKFRNAVQDLYAKLQKVHTDPVPFAITAVVKVCEIT